jgi:hypothetical protein
MLSRRENHRHWPGMASSRPGLLRPVKKYRAATRCSLAET